MVAAFIVALIFPGVCEMIAAKFMISTVTGEPHSVTAVRAERSNIMRVGILVAALGMVVGVPVVASSLAPAAMAQDGAEAISPEEMVLEGKIVAMAQAGNTEGIDALIESEVRQGRSAMLARVAKRIAAQARAIAKDFSDESVAMIKAAVSIASNQSVIEADNTVETAVGVDAQEAKSAMQTTNPLGASEIQTAVAISSSSNLQVAYVSHTPSKVDGNQSGSTPPQLGGGDLGRTTGTTTLPVVIQESNPAQQGSPT